MILSIWENIGSVILGALGAVFFFIDRILAMIIAVVYDFMIYVASAKFFDVKYVRDITTSLYTLIGIFILFYVAVELIKAIMNPDNLLSGEGSLGKISSRIFITLVLIVSVPWIFNVALPQVQKILIGTSGYNENATTQGVPGLIQGILSEESIEDSRPGLSIAGTMLTAFVTPTSESALWSFLGGTTGNTDIEVENCDDIFSDVKTGTDSSINFWNSSGDLNVCMFTGTFLYTPIIPTIVIGIALILMVSFLFDILKVICELWFLEIISPIPIMMYLLPQHTMFDNWVKAVKNAFVKLIIRVASISLLIIAMNAVKQVLAAFVSGTTVGHGFTTFMNAVLEVCLIIGIVMFARDLPNTLSTIFGIEMGGGLNWIGKKGLGLGMKTLGAIGGGIAGGVAARRAAKHAGLTRKERREAAKLGRQLGRAGGWSNSSIEGINTKDGVKLATDTYGGTVKEQRAAARTQMRDSSKLRSEYAKNTRLANSAFERDSKTKDIKIKSGAFSGEDAALVTATQDYINAQNAEEKYKTQLDTIMKNPGASSADIEKAQQQYSYFKQQTDKAETKLKSTAERSSNSKDREIVNAYLDKNREKL